MLPVISVNPVRNWFGGVILLALAAATAPLAGCEQTLGLT